MVNITATPEYTKEESRIEAEKRKITELTGYGEEVWGEYYRSGFTAKEIVDEINKGKKEALKEKGGQELRDKVAQIEASPGEILSLIKERLEEKALEKIAPKTGLAGLDAIIRGFVPGHLYTLTGHTNVGKTSLACNFANAVAAQGKRVLYLALEPDNTVIDYLASVSAKKMFDEVSEVDYGTIPKSIEYFKKDKVSTPEKLIEVLRKLDRYDLVIVDHVGYFITDTRNPFQTQANVIKMLAAIAKERRCAVMIIAHMRKAAGPRKKKTPLPSMDDIAGSAAFKQDSTDVLIAIRDEDPSDEFHLTYLNTGNVLVTKTKSGPNGRVPIQFVDGSAVIKQKEATWATQRF